MSTPSQRRYGQYLVDILRAHFQPEKMSLAVVLRRIVLSGMPKRKGGKPFLPFLVAFCRGKQVAGSLASTGFGFDNQNDTDKTELDEEPIGSHNNQH